MRRKFFVAIFVLIVAASLMSGCASHKGTGIPGIAMGDKIELNPLERSEYEVLGPATGKACVTVNTLLPLPIVWYSGDYSRDPLGGNEKREYGQISFPVTSTFGKITTGQGTYTSSSTKATKRPDLDVGFGFWLPDPGLKAKEAAVFKAIQSVPDADAILSPRFYVEKEKRFVWYKRVCVTVKGKAIRIKIDKDLQ